MERGQHRLDLGAPAGRPLHRVGVAEPLREVALDGGKVRAEGACDDLLTAGDKTIIETDALSSSEVEAVDRYLREQTGHVVRRIAKPRQRLEDLFLEIVDKARTERIETSGAQAGGPTAAFLMGQSTDGESLIQRLVEGEASAPEKAAPERAQAAPEPVKRGPDESVIGDLLEEKEAPKGAAPERKKDDRPAPKRSADVDLGVIESLTKRDRPDDAEPRR